MNVYFNPLDSLCKNIIGAVRQGDELQISLFVLKSQKEFSYNMQTLCGKSVQPPIKTGFFFWERTEKKEISIS